MQELIDRETLIKDMCNNNTEAKCPCYPNCYPCDFSEARRIIDIQPTIDAEPVRHGRWIPTEYDSYADGAPVWDKWECSECGHEHNGEEDTLTPFCPACGARMDGGDDNG